MVSRSRSRRQGSLAREVNTRRTIQTVLVVCEGKETEPNYFNGFRVATLNVKAVGIGSGPLGVVNEAIRLSKQEEYDNCWCVFDRDDTPADVFNKAIDKARRSGMDVAYSNPSFELWFLLHFEYCDCVLDRHQYCIKLENHLGIPYRKNLKDMHRKLHAYQATAIQRAGQLYSQYDGKQHLAAANCRPCTTVFRLVEFLASLTKA